MSDWDERYRRGEHSAAEPLPLLVEWEPRIAAATGGRGRVLDLASGPGRHALFLAERGWRVTAVDASEAALNMLRQEAKKRGVELDAEFRDLEGVDVSLPSGSYDLILDCCFLYRPLFPVIRAALAESGVFLGAWPMADDDPQVRSMNPRYLANPPEISDEFKGWRVLHRAERKPRAGKRRMFELVVQR